MITTHTGTGFLALAEKLQELWEFYNTEYDDNEKQYTLWISPEVYIVCLEIGVYVYGGDDEGSYTTALSGSSGAWKIIRTACGIAFGTPTQMCGFIGRTVKYDGAESYGCIARRYDTATYTIYADGMTRYDTMQASYFFDASTYYTQLLQAACATASSYFPDLYFITQSPQTADRVSQIGADVYYCGEMVALRDTPAQTGTGGESVDLSNYYTAPQVDTKIRAVEQVIAELESDLRGEIESVAQSITAFDTSLRSEVKSVEQSVESLAADVASVSEKAEATESAVAELSGDLSDLGVVIEEVKNAQKLYTAPMQDASVEGRYMLFAEYVFPQKSNYESADVTFLVRNRGVNSTAEDGVLRVRLRYGKSAQAYQYAQIYFTQCSGLDAAKIILCCNGASGTAQLWLDASTAYAGYIFKVLDMGTSASIVDYTAWTLYSPTTGVAELPSEADGWTAVTAAGVAAASE